MPDILTLDDLSLHQNTLQQIHQILGSWFADHGRDLPWRRTRDPYHILVAELMLQQTQVDRVLPKYAAFLAEFPTVEVLAAAPTAAVIRAWAGLGYNRRAVNLQRTARVVCDIYAGQFPREVEQLRGLPGIGPYTAGAIACFAFEQDVAFLDTNIRRVIQRLFVGTTPVAERLLWELAEQVVPSGHGWGWNQAIMELGALICRATNPLCWRCPLNSVCRDYQSRMVADQQLLVAEVPTPTKRVAERREQPFVGSNRYYRGRVIEALRQAPDHGMELQALGPLVKPDWLATELDWLEQLLAGLVRDGLVQRDGQSVRLPE